MSTNSYLANLEAQLPLCQTCAELQKVVNGMMASLSAVNAEITAQLAGLEAFLALVTPPTDLNSLIQWVENFINAAIGPQVAAYNKLVAQLAQLAKDVAQLVTAIENAAAALVDCQITIPPL